MTVPGKGGRPLKFESPEILQELIDKYFETCDENDILYTVGGLAVALKCDRRTLINYKAKEEFFPTIKNAKQKIESAIELHCLTTKNPAGAIFNLKNNFDWKDKQELDTTLTVNIQLDDQLIAGRQKLREKLLKTVEAPVIT